MSQVPQLSLCPHCRAELPEDGSFCNACGRRVEGWKKPPIGAAPAASASVESESATRRMEPTPSLLRAAAVPAAAVPASDTDSGMMRSVRTRRTPVVVGAIALLAVGAGVGAYRLLRHPATIPPPAPPVAAQDPVNPVSPVVPVVGKTTRHRRATHRAEPVDVNDGKGQAIKSPAHVNDPLPKKTVTTDSRPLPSAKSTPGTKPTPAVPLVPPDDLPSDSTPLTEAELEQQKEASIDADGVRFVIKSHISQVHACYTRFFKDSSPGGRIDLGFVIGKDGRASRAKAEANTTGSAEVAGCLEARIKEWEFPRPVGGDYELVYPFVFAAGS